jgi:hypothetical protein
MKNAPRSALVVAIALAVAAGSTVVSADRIKLRSGRSVDGAFLSADVKIIRLLMANGSIAEFPLDDVAALELSPRKSPPPPAPDPSRAPSPVTLPAGTALNIRIVEAIDVDAARTGATFKSLLDDPVMIGGAVVVPRGSLVMLQAVNVEQAGKMKGSDKITLKAKSLAFGGRTYDIVSTAVESKGGGEGKKTGRDRRSHWRRRRRGGRGHRLESGHGTSENCSRDSTEVFAGVGGDRQILKGARQPDLRFPAARASPPPPSDEDTSAGGANRRAFGTSFGAAGSPT